MPVVKKHLSKRVDRIRRNVRAPFGIRGVQRHGEIPDPKISHPSVSYYFVNPLVKLDSKQFTKRFHASLNAAIARAIPNALLKVTSAKGNARKVSAAFIPTVIFLHGHPPNFATIRRLRKFFNSKLKFDEKDISLRPMYEVGLVRGKKRRTFSESATSYSQVEILLKVRMTKKEFEKAIADAKHLLKKKTGLSCAMLRTMEGQGKKGEQEAWNQVMNTLGIKRIERTEETSNYSIWPTGYLLGEFVRKSMLNKCKKKFLAWQEKLPE